PDDQPDQTHGEENRQRLYAPEWIAQPVPLLSLAEHHLPADHDDDEQRQADRVKTERPALQLRTFLREVVRIAQHRITRSKRQKTDRDVDEKHPAPRVAVRYPTAEGRSHDRRQQGSKAEQRHRYALLLARGKASSRPPGLLG